MKIFERDEFVKQGSGDGRWCNKETYYPADAVHDALAQWTCGRSVVGSHGEAT
jgi:hypothetical protein